MTTVRKWVDKCDMQGVPLVRGCGGDQVRRARRFVASRAVGVEDCRALLDALGIGFTPEEIAEVSE